MQQVRDLEAPLLASGVPLMQRAATGLAHAVARELPGVYGARVLLLVGGGNNGADALWAGVRLARRGAQVSAVLVGTPVEDALQAFRTAGGRVVDTPGAADVVVDGMVGIGGRGPLRPGAAALLDLLPGAPVVAVDVPSGVDADTGEVPGRAVVATTTVTFGALKPGLLLARAHVGRLQLVDVGLAPVPTRLHALEASDVARLLPRAEARSDKYTRGVVGVAAGSSQYTGAAVLAVGSALQAGAGMVRFAGAEHPGEQVRGRWPEAVVTPFSEAGRVQAWVVGPGLGTDADDVVAQVLASDVPVLVDADALTVCARRPELLRRDAPTLLTPHDREFARFGSEVGGDRVGSARDLAARLGVHVLLKGDATVVVGPDGQGLVNTTGTPLLATAGSGDVLAGAVGSLLAQGLDPLVAGGLGAHLHGRAGGAVRTRYHDHRRRGAGALARRGAGESGRMRSEARVELAAITANVRALDALAGSAQVMAVVKADGYGHGLLPSARAALAGGAGWLGVAFLEEALAVRSGGVDAPLLAWLWSPDEDVAAAVAADVDLGVYSLGELQAVAEAARTTGREARVHLKVDTGLSRGGAVVADWPDLCAAAARTDGVRVVGVWSHFAHADAGPDHPFARQQVQVFTEAVDVARRSGLRPDVLHLANSAATLTAPHAHFDLVRPGVSVYGLAAARVSRRLRPPPRHDAALDRGPDQAGTAGQRGLLPAPVRHRPRGDPRARPAGLRRRRPARRHQRPAGAAPGRPPHRRRHRLHGPVPARRRGRRRRGR